MSDTQRGRPVLRRIEGSTVLPTIETLEVMAEKGKLWFFCGEYEGTSTTGAVDEAVAEHGPGIFKVFPSGSWAGGYLRD